jgi:hypothetical protein
MTEYRGYIADTDGQYWKPFVDSGLLDAEGGYGQNYGMGYGGNHRDRYYSTFWVKDTQISDGMLGSLNVVALPTYPYDGDYLPSKLPNIHPLRDPNFYSIESFEGGFNSAPWQPPVYPPPAGTGFISEISNWADYGPQIMSHRVSMHNQWVHPDYVVED